MAREMNVSATEIATAAVEFWRQGLDEDEVNRRLEATIQYAKISVAAIQQLTAEAFNAVKANIDQLDAGSINASKIDRRRSARR